MTKKIKLVLAGSAMAFILAGMVAQGMGWIVQKTAEVVVEIVIDDEEAEDPPANPGPVVGDDEQCER